jgi:hypothetical protein
MGLYHLTLGNAQLAICNIGPVSRGTERNGTINLLHFRNQAAMVGGLAIFLVFERRLGGSSQSLNPQIAGCEHPRPHDPAGW